MAARNLYRADAPPPFRCVVLLNPPNPASLGLAAPDFFESPLGTPALVCKGELDDVVPGGPEAYGPLFASVEWESQPDGHVPLPSDPQASEELVKKVRAFVGRYS
jgi:hypothetical protein